MDTPSAETLNTVTTPVRTLADDVRTFADDVASTCWSGDRPRAELGQAASRV
jgi:hypothetical protein